jgi:formylglycine-generating enzyme required for sulfatase activity
VFALAADAKDPPKEFTNSIGMKFVLVPAGEFMMGSDETAEERAKDYPQVAERKDYDRLQPADEAPAHKVKISKPFYFGTYEVTRGQFRKFVEDSGRKSDAETDGTGGYGAESGRPVIGEAFAGRDPKYNWLNPGWKQTDEHPVVNVTWYDAVAMCDWLSKKEGAKYRLPTEAEWEYSCRAGADTRYHNGDSPKDLAKIANVYDIEAVKEYPQWKDQALQQSDGFSFTSPVGSYKPNAFGLYDMHGSVWEWCSDWYDKDYYKNSPAVDPQGPADGGQKVRRGGSWHTWPFYCRATYRNYNTRQSRYTLLGMRLVKEVE